MPRRYPTGKSRHRMSAAALIITTVVITIPRARAIWNRLVSGLAYIPNGWSGRAMRSALISMCTRIVGKPVISSIATISAMMGTYSAKCECARIALRNSSFPPRRP